MPFDVCLIRLNLLLLLGKFLTWHLDCAAVGSPQSTLPSDKMPAECASDNSLAIAWRCVTRFVQTRAESVTRRGSETAHYLV